MRLDRSQCYTDSRRPESGSGEHLAAVEVDAGVCVFITAGPIIKVCAGGEGDSEGHVL